MRAVRTLALGLPLACACSVFVDWDRLVGDRSGEPPPDAAFDVAPGSDASSADAGSVGPSFAEETAWESFDVTNIHLGAKGGGGLVYDGRYVYFPPFGNVALRHDPTRPLADVASWEAVTLPWSNFFAGTFDGTYVYFGPGSGAQLTAARFDPKGRFGDLASWSFFSVADLLTSRDAGALQSDFRGVLSLDSDEILFVPFFDPDKGARQSRLVRFDRKGAFDDPSSWSFESLGTVPYYGGALIDDRLVLGPVEDRPMAMRELTGGSDAGWLLIKPSDFSPITVKFYGVVSDGRYLYLTPHTSSQVGRFDPTQPPTGRSAWSFSGGPGRTAGFYGGTFDGRYVYLAPAGVDIDNRVHYARYDATQPFDRPDSWETHYVPTDAGVQGTPHRGAVFEGRYVYFAPGVYSSLVVRFRARDEAAPAGLPPGAGRYSP